VDADEPNAADRADEFDLVAVWRGLRPYRFVIISLTVLFGLVALISAVMTEPYFRAEVTIAAAREEGLNGSAALSQLSGLASLAGVNLGGGTSPQREALAVLKSRHLIQEFIERNDLLPLLFRGSHEPPTLWRAVKMFQAGVVNIREDTRQGVTVVAMAWTDPAIAAQWANAFVGLANEILRDRALVDSKRNIAYLNEQVSKTDVVELRRVMYSLIENETKTLMLANGRPDYAFTVVDPAVPPELKAGPHRAIATLIGLSLGFLLGLTIAVLHRTLSRFRRRLAQAS
jgi:uncharacterized protein involved in exopolysaccharide biosynthesis